MVRLNLLLLGLILCFGFSVVTSQYKTRILYSQLEHEKQIQRLLDVEQGKLELEQSTWATQARIEQIATAKLLMVMPSLGRLKMIMPDGEILAPNYGGRKKVADTPAKKIVKKATPTPKKIKKTRVASPAASTAQEGGL